MRKPLSQRQYLDGELLVVKIDGTATPVVSIGANQVTCVRSNGTGTRDRLTITFKKPIFGMTPAWVTNSNTTAVVWKDVAGTSSKTALVLDSVAAVAGTAISDGSGTFFIYGPTVTKEGNY